MGKGQRTGQTIEQRIGHRGGRRMGHGIGQRTRLRSGQRIGHKMGDRTVHKVWKMIQKRRGQMAGQGQFIGEDRTDCRTVQINVQRTVNRRG